MARAYSIDLRERAVEYVSVGGDRDEACQIFRIGLSTLQRWIKQKQSTGDLSPKPMGSRPWKLDHAAIVKHVESSDDSTLQEIAEHFKTGKSAIEYILNKRGVTRKKNDALRRARRTETHRLPC
jgi:transposase